MMALLLTFLLPYIFDLQFSHAVQSLNGSPECHQAVEYKGEGIHSVQNVKSAAKCQQLCANDMECGFFTYYKKFGRCVFHEKGENSVANSETISGPKRCVECFVSGVKLHSSDYVSSTVEASREACAERCRMSILCSLYNFTSYKECQLYESEKSLDSMVFSLGDGIGKKHCSDDTWCLLRGTKLSGYDTKIVPSSDGEGCRRICMNTPDCVVFSYEDGQCKLKNGNALYEKIPTVGALAGPPHCGLPQPCERTKQIGLLDPIIMHSSSISTTARTCQQLCRNDPRCFFYAQSPDGCALHGKYAVLVPGGSGQTTAGPITC